MANGSNKLIIFIILSTRGPLEMDMGQQIDVSLRQMLDHFGLQKEFDNGFSEFNLTNWFN